MAAYRYYKLNCTVSASSGVFMINEIELYLGLSGAPGSDITTPSMTVTDNQNYGVGHEGAKAFNNSFTIGDGSRWQMNGQSYPIWVKIDLGSGNTQEVLSHMVMADDPTYAPQDWTLQGSNDDSTWTTVATVTSQTGWGAGERRVFNNTFVYSVSGTVKDTSNNGIARTVRVLRKSDGTFIGETTSNASTGIWSVNTPTQSPLQIIAFKSSANDEEALIFDGVTAV